MAASRCAVASSFARVDLRARWAAASPPARRSQELSGGGCRPVPEPMPLSPRLIAGLSSSASAGPIGWTSGLDALEFGALDLEVLDSGVLPDFLGVSGDFAIPGIWGESGSEKRVKARARTRGVHCQGVASAVSRCQQRRRNALRLRRRLDDIEMDPAALHASHGPVFGVAAGDNAQHGKPGVAVRTAGRRLRRGGRARLGFAWRHGCSHFRAGYGEVWRSADGGIIPGRCLNWSISVFASAMAAS